MRSRRTICAASSIRRCAKRTSTASTAKRLRRTSWRALSSYPGGVVCALTSRWRSRTRGWRRRSPPPCMCDPGAGSPATNCFVRLPAQTVARSRTGAARAHDVSTVRPLGEFGRLEDPLVDTVHRELLARAVARGAALAQDCCVGQGVGSGRYVVVATLAGSGDRRRGLSEAARTGDQRLSPDVLDQISAGQVTGVAVAEIAREPDVLVIGSPQHVGIDQVLATVDAVDLPGEVHALIRSAIR